MKRAYVVVLGLVVVGAAVAGLALRKGRAKPIEYRTASVERGDVIATVSSTGTVKPVEEVTVGSQVSGTLAAILVDYNDPVTEGQVIARLDDRLLRAQLEQNDANTQRASVAVDDAKRTFGRAQELAQRDLISDAELDAARLAVRQREAELRQTEAARDLARVNLEHAVIRAPISGVIVSRAVDVGQTVAASLQAPTLFTIARDLGQMQVEASIDEADVGTVAPGLKTTFTVDAYPDISFDGRVQEVRLEPVTVQNVVTYTAIIRASNPDLLLKPGMTANVWITTAEAYDVMRVPNAALRFRPDGARRGAWGSGGSGGPPQGMRANAGGAGAGDAAAATRGGDRGRRSGSREEGAGTGASGAPEKGGRRAWGGGAGSVGAAPRDSAPQPGMGGPPGMDGPPGADDPPSTGGMGRPNLTPEQRERWRARIDSVRAAGGDPRELWRSFRGGSEPPRVERSREEQPASRAAAPLVRTRQSMDAAVTEGARRIAQQKRPGTVYVLGPDGKPTPVRVLTGVSDGTFSAVVSGDLPPMAKVVLGIKTEQKVGPQMASPLTQGPMAPPSGGSQGRSGR